MLLPLCRNERRQLPYLARGRARWIDLENGAPLRCTFSEHHTLTENGIEHRHVIRRERTRHIAADRRIYDFAINRKSGTDAFLVDPRLTDEVHHLFGSPHIVGRWLHRNDDPIAREDGRATELIHA